MNERNANVSRKSGRWVATVTAAWLATLFAVGSLQAADGSFTGTYRERLSSSDCGVDTDVGPVRGRIAPNGRWSARLPEGKYSGRYSSTSQGRKITLVLDESSKRRFERELAAWASDLCGVRVNIDDLPPTIKVKSKLNKKRTSITGTIKVRARGSSEVGSGQGTYTGKLTGVYVAR